MSTRLRVAGGRVYDPANRIDGEIRDVCIEGARIVAGLPPDAPTLDATGLVVMPGAVDVHTHLVGPEANMARRLSPERRRAPALAPGAAGAARLRSGTIGTAPSTFATGQLYSRLGYTTVLDAAVPMLGARQAHLEFGDTPLLDKGFYLVLGNDEFLLRPIAEGDEPRTLQTLAWALSAARAYGVKVVNPGGIAAWKAGRPLLDLDEVVPGRDLTPRRILLAFAAACDALKLPHPMHLHCNNLGTPGNAATTLATMRALEGRRAHLAHLQFHCYGGERGGRLRSRAPEVIEALNANPRLSADVGQVLFGPTMTMTADGRVAERLAELTGNRWTRVDFELEGSCGIVPYEYRERNAVHAAQWVTGLELMLLAADPWRLVLSTDHPNGATFLSYPRLIRLLMDRGFREEQMARLPARALEGTALGAGLPREYGLSEIAIITRAGPARLLGLTDKGHLGPGADADLALYAPDRDYEAMFQAPRHVFKGGVAVVRDGRVQGDIFGRTLSVAREHDPGVERWIERLLAEEGSLRVEDYVIGEDELVPTS